MNSNVTLDFNPVFTNLPPEMPTFEKEKAHFEHIFYSPVLPYAPQAIIYAVRSGHNLLLKPNCRKAAERLDEWKQNIDTVYPFNNWGKFTTLDQAVIHTTIPGLKDHGLKIGFEPDLWNCIRNKQKFYQKENIRMADVPIVLRDKFERHMETLKSLGIYDKLFPYQRTDACIHAIKNYSFLGYGMRLGKSRVAIAAALLKKTKHNLIICPSRLINTWYNTICNPDVTKGLGLDKSIVKIITKPSDLEDLRQFNIIGRETLRRQDKDNGPVICEWCGALVTGTICMAPNMDIYAEKKTCGWNKRINSTCPKCNAQKEYTGHYCNKCGYSDIVWTPGIYKRMKKLFSFIISDESHGEKNKNSQQGRAVRTLKAKHKMILTGTILENYISECFWQLWFLLGKGGPRFPYKYNGGYTQFTEKYCKFTKTPSGRTKKLPAIQNEGEFYYMLDSIMTRRTKDDPEVKAAMNTPEIKGGKPKLILVTPTDEERILYNQALNNFEVWYRAEMEKVNASPEWMLAGSRKRLSAQVLVKLNALRRISSCSFMFDSYRGDLTAKIQFIQDVVQAKNMAGEKVLISSVHRPLVKKLLEAIPDSEGFTGEMPHKKRSEIMDRFKTEEYPKNLIVSTACCNLGEDLSAATTMIIADLDWSPKVLEQMWERIQGPNQKKESEVMYLINKDMIDESMNELIQGKDRAIDKAIDRIDTDEEIEFYDWIEFADKMLDKRKGE
jgi:ribosomal protein L40E